MGILPLVRRKRVWIQGARREGDEGILDDMSRVVRNALEMNIPLEDIFRLTGFSKDEIVNVVDAAHSVL